MSEGKKIRVTQVRSKAHRLQAHKDTLRGLGLRRIGHCVELKDTPEVRGMVHAVAYLVRVEELS